MKPSSAARLFVAIPVPDAIKNTLRQVQAELRDVVPARSASWTKADNMHLTLSFLGNLEMARIGELQSRLSAEVTGFGGLKLVCERLGCFPDLRFPRVVWAWVHDANDYLSALAQRVNEAAAPFANKPPEGRFTGHITLARPRQIRRPESERLAQFIETAVGRQFGAWEAGCVELIRSELFAGGSQYTTLATFDLSGAEPI